jgi:arylsulfatase A-like enzyme
MRAVFAGLLGGAWGGALVGLIEAGLITATSGPAEEYWLFPYAVISYGLSGMLLGAGCAAVALALRAVTGQRRTGPFGAAVAVAVLVLGGAVARYHVVQRVFHEELVTVSAVGLAVHLAVFAVIGACAVLALLLGNVLQRHRRGLIVAASGLALCLAISSGAAVLAAPHGGEPAVRRATAGGQGRPNIILIIADTLRADAVGAYNGASDVTPALDHLAADGVRFENAYSQSTWTRPSIATILTSLYPSVHGAVHKMDALPDGVTTLAEALRARGYWTAGFVSNINVAPVFNFQQGFEEYAYLAPDFYFGATDSATRLAIYKGLRVLRERLFRDRIYFYHYYQDAQVVCSAVERWLDQRPPVPFFVLIHFMDPHDPYFELPYNGKGVARVSTPDPPADQKDRLHRLYARKVTYLDHQLEGLFAKLKALGLYDGTIIAMTADHGEEFQEHGGWWHGTTLYQEQMRVPLIVKRAHEPQARTVDTGLARSLDVAPTLMVAAGLTVPDEFTGHDLFGSTPREPARLFAEEDFEGNVLAALRMGPWKLITANAGNPRGLRPMELYNLAEDAAERNNLAAAEPARVQEMLRLLGEEEERVRERAAVSGVGEADHAADHRS